MKNKKPYVSPTVISVKLEPTQAVLSQCSVGVANLWKKRVPGMCSVSHNCKMNSTGGHNPGDSAGTS